MLSGAFSQIGQPLLLLIPLLQIASMVGRPLTQALQAKLVEIMALLQGVLLAQELHLPRVIMESDALAAIQAINDKSTGSSSGHLM